MISRRRFIGATGGALALAGLGHERAGSAQAARPNIVFILADDLGYADLSCYGRRDYTTPSVDRLAGEGMRFTQGYANSAVCSPTRVALITGRYQYRLPVGLEEPITAMSSRSAGLPAGHPTLPSLLKRVGYATALVGKWHLGTASGAGPLRSGYDQFFGVVGGAANYFDHGPGSANPLVEGEVAVERHGYLTTLLADRAVETLDRFGASKTPFLLSLHFTAPHWPWLGPDDEAESRRLTSLWHHDGGSQKTYAAMVRSLDASVGRVLQALERDGLAGDTIVVFTSDNGGERFSDTWPFSGMKEELLEGGLRVPAIVRWPGRVRAGSVSDQVAITMDWMPTLLAAAGAPGDPAFPPDGEDLASTLSGGASHPRKLYWRYRAGAQRALREGDWKYLAIAGNEFLFDVTRDPRERANLKAPRADVFLRLKTDWEAWNRTMLPESPSRAALRNSGGALADHYGVSTGD